MSYGYEWRHVCTFRFVQRSRDSLLAVTVVKYLALGLLFSMFWQFIGWLFQITIPSPQGYHCFFCHGNLGGGVGGLLYGITNLTAKR